MCWSLLYIRSISFLLNLDCQETDSFLHFSFRLVSLLSPFSLLFYSLFHLSYNRKEKEGKKEKRGEKKRNQRFLLLKERGNEEKREEKKRKEEKKRRKRGEKEKKREIRDFSVREKRK
jgi:flagellar biosynthesis/type III secretory pathway M-ring protein FliF/YscJ